MNFERLKKASPFIYMSIAVISSICASVFFDSLGISFFLFAIFGCLGAISYKKMKTTYSDKANRTVVIICFACIPISILCLLAIYFLISQ